MKIKNRYKKVLKTILDNLEFELESHNFIEEFINLKLGKRIYYVIYYTPATFCFPPKLQYYLNYKNYLFKTLFEYNKICPKEYLFPLNTDIFLTFQCKRYKILTAYPYTKNILKHLYWTYLSSRELANINLLLDNGLSDLIEEQIEIIEKNWDSLSYWESIDSKI